MPERSQESRAIDLRAILPTTKTIIATTPTRPGAKAHASLVRAQGPVRIWLGLLLFASAFAILWDVLAFDLAISDLFGSIDGFALRDRWLWRTVFHDGFVWLARGVLVLTWLWAGFGPLPSAWPRSRWLLGLTGVTLALLLVALLKNLSPVSCPWDLSRYGGVAQYVPHWLWQADGGRGRCFPGGHVSSAFAWWPLAAALTAAEPAAMRRTGWYIAAAALGFGLWGGVVQTVRGAHYPSHTFWTAALCLAVAALVAWGLTRRKS